MPDETHQQLIQFETRGTRESQEFQTALANAIKDLGVEQRVYNAIMERGIRIWNTGVSSAHAIRNAISGVQREFAATREEISKPPDLTWMEQLNARLRDVGASAEFTTQATARFKQLMAADIPGKRAIPQAERETLGLFRERERLAREGPPIDLTARERLAAKLKEIGADAEFTTEAFRRFDEVVEKHTPKEMAVSQAIRETASSFRTLGEEVQTELSWLEKLQARLDEIGASKPIQPPATVSPIRQVGKYETEGVADIAGTTPTLEELQGLAEAFNATRTIARELGDATDFTSRAIARFNQLVADGLDEQYAYSRAIGDVRRELMQEAEAADRAAEAHRRRARAFTRGRQVTGGPGGEVGVSPQELFTQRETVAAQRRDKDLDWFVEMAEKMEESGISLENQIKIIERYDEVLDQSLTPQAAFSRAQREIAKELQTTGEAAKTSGNWLGRYIQRYLIRYLVVWQGMVAVRRVISDWRQAHEELAQSMFRLQSAMQLTGSDARQYMATLQQVGGQIGVPAEQMVGGARQAGPELAGQMARFGQVTEMGVQPAIEFFTEIQRQYDLTNDQLEMFIARMFTLWSTSGRSINDLTSNWQELIGTIGEGPQQLEFMRSEFERFGDEGRDATDRIATGWRLLLQQFGDTSGFDQAKMAVADLFDYLNENVETITFAFRTMPMFSLFFQAMDMVGAGQQGPATTVPGATSEHEQWRLTGQRPSVAGQGPAPIQKFMGRMTRDELQEFRKIHDAVLEQMKLLGVMATTETRTVAIWEEGILELVEIKLNTEATAIATEEMRDVQQRLLGWYNLPTGAAGIMVGRTARLGPETPPQQAPAPQAQQAPTTAVPIFSPEYRNWFENVYLPGIEANPPGWQDHEDWRLQSYRGGEEQQGYLRGGEQNWVYPGQGLPQESQPGLFDQIITAIRNFVTIELDGQPVASSTSEILGDELDQAYRAAAGFVGGLLSP